MKKWLFRVIWIPVLILTVLFLVANRQLVAVSLDPFNAEAPALTTPALPLWAWLMVMLFVGLGAGAFGAWLSARPKRVAARADRKRVRELSQEVTRLETRLRDADAERQAHRTSVPSAEPPLLESEDA